MLAYIRYRQVDENLSEDSIHSDRLNKAALVAGVTSAFGFTLIGHFPVCCFVMSVLIVYCRAVTRCGIDDSELLLYRLSKSANFLKILKCQNRRF